MNTKNLKILADGLSGKINPVMDVSEVTFNMEVFQRSTKENPVNCGSSGCAVGWAPFFGINKRPKESWCEYSERVFDLPSDSLEWEWCFSEEWSRVDNRKEGAAKRIYWLLEHGLPENWDLQMREHEELCYNETY